MSSNYKLTIGYAVVVVFMLVGFLRLETLASELEREGIARANQLCENQNELRSVMRQIVAQALAPPDNLDELDPAFQRYFEQIADDRQDLQESVQDIADPVMCPPPPANGSE